MVSDNNLNQVIIEGDITHSCGRELALKVHSNLTVHFICPSASVARDQELKALVGNTGVKIEGRLTTFHEYKKTKTVIIADKIFKCDKLIYNRENEF